MALHAGDECSICYKGKLVIIGDQASGQHFKCDYCGGLHANAFGTANVGASVTKLHAKSGDKVEPTPPKQRIESAREIEHLERGTSKIRYVKDRTTGKTVVFQLACTPEDKLKHVECKYCGKKWYLADGEEMAKYFRLENQKLTCLSCNSESEISSV